ncbi:Glycine--tRNA ligase beta subunit [Buchnera aphidicola (Eriosoma lanigerum)]|uniref:glycine--tRNA ligase subunit beta n=1 Tax=Buchnera aphidicola TaxID=9 RepID=UPI003463A5B5
MNNNTFIVELGVEELPAKKLYNIALSFHEQIKKEIINNNIHYKKIKWFATPRRIAVQIKGIDIKNNIKKEIILKGPLIKNAFNKYNKPTNSTKFWIKKNNINLQETSTIETIHGTCLAYKKIEILKFNNDIFSNIVKSAIEIISIGKLMKWNINEKKFFRPIRTVTLMYNDIIVPLQIFNVCSNQFIRGHQIIDQPILLTDANKYSSILFNQGKVIACYQKRLKIIENECNIASSKKGCSIELHDQLLHEINSLVEWPVVHVGKFKKKFLELPEIAIIHTIENDQKCIPMYKNKSLSCYFIFVSNISNVNFKNIIIGNERVINARLSDAQFFFQQDRKKKLIDQLILLKKVVFQKKLGSLFEKTNRIISLSQFIANHQIQVNIDHVRTAATLSKCDLISHMVTAFPKIQGIIGMHYAILDGIDKEIATAIKDQYKPEFSGDILPKNTIGDILSISDKIDLITGMFSIGNHPSSDKDPFALRRSAIGILRIILEKKISIDLKKLIEKSLHLYNTIQYNCNIVQHILHFFINRLHDLYQKQGYKNDIIKAVLKINQTNLIKVNLKIQAITYLQTFPDYQSIILSIKRISNILKQFDFIVKETFNISLIDSEDEKILYTLVSSIKNKIKNISIEKKYFITILELIKLSQPIHNFFCSSKINHNNYEIKMNRLHLLKMIEELFFTIADFSILETT